MFVKHQKAIFDLSKTLEGYEGKWVALSLKGEQFVISASGNSLNEVIDKAKNKEIDDPIVLKVPSELTSYVL